jgi:hypothetical protein
VKDINGRNSANPFQVGLGKQRSNGRFGISDHRMR